MFLRSIDKYNLKYCEFNGDGESGCFGAMKETCEIKYGNSYSPIEEEFVGYVHKRMGTGIREYIRKNKGRILSDGKKVDGTNRLTDKIVNKIQNYYGQAIRNNTGDKESDAYDM